MDLDLKTTSQAVIGTVSDYEVRIQALALAADLKNHGEVSNLLRTAAKIEAYIRNGQAN